jgi:hypothetical protein
VLRSKLRITDLGISVDLTQKTKYMLKGTSASMEKRRTDVLDVGVKETSKKVPKSACRRRAETVKSDSFTAHKKSTINIAECHSIDNPTLKRIMGSRDFALLSGGTPRYRPECEVLRWKNFHRKLKGARHHTLEHLPQREFGVSAKNHELISLAIVMIL